MRYWKNTNTLDAYVPELLSAVSVDAEIAVIGSKPLNLDHHPHLKGIFKCGVGVDNIPYEECKSRGILVGMPSQNTRDVIFEETANFTVYTILKMLYSDLGNIDSWVKNQRPLLNRRRVLIIGLGNIGKKVRNKLLQLTEVLEYDIESTPENDLERFLKIADIVTLHIPLTDKTKGWFDASKLSCMHDNSVLINTARGAIVNENDLLLEIRSGRMRAAFDVFWEEPYHGPLRNYHPDRFLMTPHVASTCENFLSGLASDLQDFVYILENEKA